jgi:YebC/PmpR family DNA-binding regulatory protein
MILDMSGHSKWSTIKRQKGAADIKRGQVFTKLANAIGIAVRQNGGNTDPETNFKLRLAIDKARSYNMPKDNIERSIQKAAGVGGGGDLQEALYEGFAPGGSALLIEAVTDNNKRTVSEVKNTLEKNGGTLAGQGAVSYLFDRVGEIAVNLPGKTDDELLDLALEINSSDFQKEGDDVIFYVAPTELAQAKKTLEKKAIATQSAELVYKPQSQIEIDEGASGKVKHIIEKLEDLGDVQSVYSNAQV